MTVALTPNLAKRGRKGLDTKKWSRDQGRGLALSLEPVMNRFPEAAKEQEEGKEGRREGDRWGREGERAGERAGGRGM